MDADLTPPLKIHLPTSLPGSSVPIRAPLTIDSDSEFCLSINEQICSRASSFNSSSSIDVSSCGGDEHVSFLEEDDGFVAYPDEEMVIESCRVEEHSFTRPFVKYPDKNYVKKNRDFDISAIFRPFVKIPLEESSSAVEGFNGPGVNDFGIFSPVKLGIPVAPLTIDCDSDKDSVESHRSLSSDGIPADETVQKVAVAPKVRVFCSYEGDDKLQFDDVFSGDDIHGSNEPIKGYVSSKTIEEDEHEIEGLNEVVKISEMDEIGLLCLDEQKKGDEDDRRFDSDIVPDSDNEIRIENETIDGSEHEGVFDCYRNEESKKNSENEEQRKEDEDDISFDSQRSDGQIVSDSDNEIEIETINGIEQEGRFDYYVNESKKTSKKEEEQREEDEDNISFDLQKIDAQIIPDSDDEIKIETVNGIEQEGVFDRFSEFQKTLGKNEEEMLVKMQPIRAKFLKLVRLLGLSNEDSTVAQLLYRLTLGKPSVVEADGEHCSDEFDFSLTILVIGKTGAGKSATINAIFGENKALTDAFRPGTTTVQEIVGKIDGIRVRILDTPGLCDSPSEQSYNWKILAAIKRYTRKRSPDIVLYVDRLDTHSRDLNESHLLRSITSSLGSSVWQNCIVVLTHAANSDALPDEPSAGFVFQRCQFIQEQILHFRATNQKAANPVWLVENQNHRSYKHDHNWQTRFLLLCYSAKILHEANSVVEPSLSSLERNWFEFSNRLGHVIDLDAGSESLMGSDQVQSVEPLNKPQNGQKLLRERKKAYFENYDYRVKVFGMKHWSLLCRLHI
ncbi:translocase of chloroplast 159, chloroplastic-like [Cynara cardunculus var. scolymus]|uniref:translocase of chloroplast 159, chloroplastic-like n=1 Tax=Cynara cardunculus var. scolymus TaxID=59895 RepID=UPI000D62E516|nr:translocase of chloroplast 159, chloroplastic-like [Cynara cardunculus var. scolymus]